MIGHTYLYKTNSGVIVAFAESAVYDTDKIDLVLVGMSSGGARRKGVVVTGGSLAAAAVNTAWKVPVEPVT